MNILIVGNQNSLTHTISDILDNYDKFEIQSTTPSDLMRKINEHSLEKAEVIIADLTAFEKTAMETVQFLSELNYSFYLVVMSVYSNPKLVQPLLEAGADAHLPLEITEEELIATLSNIMPGQFEQSKNT